MNIVAQKDRWPRPALTPYTARDALEAPRPRPAMGAGGSSGGPFDGEAMFDHWLTHHLSQLYDPVVQEPIPPELLRLLELRLK